MPGIDEENIVKHKSKWLRVAPGALLLWSTVGFAEQPKAPMPPIFSYASDPADILRNYPLGIINEQTAFTHHGGAIRKIILPNGNQGWLYKVGESIDVPSLYILQFSNDGVVIDVLNKDYRYKKGHSALQYQYLQGMEAAE